MDLSTYPTNSGSREHPHQAFKVSAASRTYSFLIVKGFSPCHRLGILLLHGKVFVLRLSFTDRRDRPCLFLITSNLNLAYPVLLRIILTHLIEVYYYYILLVISFF